MSSIKHIDYMNKAILYIDLEGSASDFEVIDLGEKAKKLVKLSSRTEVFVMYNLAGVVFTKQLMLHMKGLMEHAPLVSRRVIFGTETKYIDLVQQVIANLNLAGKTRYADNYTAAVNLMADDNEWTERRGAAPNTATWKGPERRLDPAKLPTEVELQAKLDKLSGR